MTARSLAGLLMSVLLAAMVVGCDNGDDETTTAKQLALALSWDPAPPTTGQNRLTITVTHADGSPAPGATLTVDPQMPAMGHGSSETPVITEVDPGVYEAFPVTFQMPGEWTLSVTATHGTMSGSASASLNVGGAMGGM
ncbi:MAG: FixH family protein [Myxococcota bacterium]